MFDTSYRPILNRIQDSDDSQTSFIKYNLEKLARYVEQTGKDFRLNSDEMCQAVAMISSDTDCKIFIDAHKSTNQYFLQKEDFRDFIQTKVDVIGRHQRNTNLNKEESKQSAQLNIDENYIAKNGS